MYKQYKPQLCNQHGRTKKHALDNGDWFSELFDLRLTITMDEIVAQIDVRSCVYRATHAREYTQSMLIIRAGLVRRSYDTLLLEYGVLRIEIVVTFLSNSRANA